MIPLLLLCVLLSGCNFVRGVGQDMAAVGRTLTKISGTEGNESHEDVPTHSQPFDTSYEDPAYADPSDLPQ